MPYVTVTPVPLCPPYFYKTRYEDGFELGILDYRAGIAKPSQPLVGLMYRGWLDAWLEMAEENDETLPQLFQDENEMAA